MHMNFEEMAILGIPIETQFGKVEPLTILDYIELEVQLQVMSFDKKRVLHEYRLNQDEKIRETEDFTEAIKQVASEKSLKDVIVGLMSVYFTAYVAVVSASLFKHIENEEERLKQAYEFLLDLESEDFEHLRKILLSVNAQSEQTAFLDPLLQARKEKSIKFHAKDQKEESPSVTTYISSVVTFSGIPYKEVATWNYIQLIHAFQRIGQFKAYDTSTLFMTVAGDKVTPEPWNKNFKVNDDSNTSSLFAVELDAFEKNIGSKIK